MVIACGYNGRWERQRRCRITAAEWGTEAMSCSLVARLSEMLPSLRQVASLSVAVRRHVGEKATEGSRTESAKCELQVRRKHASCRLASERATEASCAGWARSQGIRGGVRALGPNDPANGFTGLSAGGSTRALRWYRTVALQGPETRIGTVCLLCERGGSMMLPPSPAYVQRGL